MKALQVKGYFFDIIGIECFIVSNLDPLSAENDKGPIEQLVC